jgi:uncharacterized protein (TIGR00730 family)
MTKPFSVTVYCSSSNTVDDVYFQCAKEVGTALAERGWRLVYGAGSVGLMGAVARAVHANGGTVYGVIPHALDSLEVTYEASDELVRVATMRERKALLESEGDGYLVLPGGFGTLEEVAEIIVLKQLGYIDRPIVFLNINNFWSPLLEFFSNLIEQQFVKPQNRHLYHVADNAADALDTIGNYYPKPTRPMQSGEAVRTALE